MDPAASQAGPVQLQKNEEVNMKAVINIEIMDDTSEELCNEQGITMENLHDLYKQGFEGIMQRIAHPGVKWELQVQITDNTKQEAQHG